MPDTSRNGPGAHADHGARHDRSLLGVIGVIGGSPCANIEKMRLDVWLDVSCLFKTRSDAQRACKGGKVVVDGVTAKPHRDVRIGSEIVITRPNSRKQIVVVLAFAETHVPKAEARRLYEDRTPPPTADEIELRQMERLYRAVTKPAGRLDRRDQKHAARRKWTT